MSEPNIVYFKNAGHMRKNMIYVESHTSGVLEELQNIDSELFVMFNPDTQKYEVHRNRLGIYTLELSLPFDELDSRAVEYLLNTRDVKKTQMEIEKHNEKLDADRKKIADHEKECRLTDLHTYCSRHEDKETLDKNAYSTRFV